MILKAEYKKTDRHLPIHTHSIENKTVVQKLKNVTTACLLQIIYKSNLGMDTAWFPSCSYEILLPIDNKLTN